MFVPCSIHFCRVLSQDEIIREGLAGKSKRPLVQVVSTGDSTGRGVLAKEAIAKRSYVCEYKTSTVYPVKEKATHDNLHEMNSAGSYVVETFYPIPKVGRLCFDATERFHHPGRYINHVARGGNVRLSRPFFIREKWRIGFLAIRDINAGEELAYDYLDRDREQKWLQEGRLVGGRVVASGKRTGDQHSTSVNDGESGAPRDEEAGSDEAKEEEGVEESLVAARDEDQANAECESDGGRFGTDEEEEQAGETVESPMAQSEVPEESLQGSEEAEQEEGVEAESPVAAREEEKEEHGREAAAECESNGGSVEADEEEGQAAAKVESPTAHHVAGRDDEQEGHGSEVDAECESDGGSVEADEEGGQAAATVESQTAHSMVSRDEEQEGHGAEADTECESDGGSVEADEEVKQAAATMESLKAHYEVPEESLQGSEEAEQEEGVEAESPVAAREEEKEEHGREAAAECESNGGSVEADEEEGQAAAKVESPTAHHVAGRDDEQEGHGSEVDAECESDGGSVEADEEGGQAAATVESQTAHSMVSRDEEQEGHGAEADTECESDGGSVEADEEVKQAAATMESLKAHYEVPEESLQGSEEAEQEESVEAESPAAARDEQQEGHGAEATAECESDGGNVEEDEEERQTAATVESPMVHYVAARDEEQGAEADSESESDGDEVEQAAATVESPMAYYEVSEESLQGSEAAEQQECVEAESPMAAIDEEQEGHGVEVDAECESDGGIVEADEEVEQAAATEEEHTEALMDSLTESECERDGEGHEQGVSTRKGESSIAHTRGRRKPGKRRYVWCPLDGCLWGPVQKLTQHLYQVHKLPPHKVARLNTPDNRRYAPTEAVKSRTPCPPRRQRTLEALLQRHPRPAIPITASSPSTSSSQGAPAPPHRPISKGKGRKGASEGQTKGKATHTPVPAPTSTSGIVSTRRMGFHKSDPFLDSFGSYLRSRTGGKRSDEATKQLCKNVSKYLFFLDSQSVRPELLLKKKPLVEYLKVVEEGYGVGCSGLLQKLDAITAALKFMKFSSIDEEEEEEVEAKIERMLQFITHQRKSYKVGKVRSERVRLEELAANPPDLSGIVTFITDPSLTEQFISTADRILGNPLQATRNQYRFCLAILAGRILYRYGRITL